MSSRRRRPRATAIGPVAARPRRERGRTRGLPGAQRPTSAIRWAAASRLQLAVASPELGRAARTRQRHRRHRGRRERAARRAADESAPRRSNATAWRRSSTDGCRSRCSPRCRRQTAGLQVGGRTPPPGWLSSLRLAGTGAQRPLWSDLAVLSMPVLIVAGALDDKFSAIVARRRGLIPNAEGRGSWPAPGTLSTSSVTNEFVDALRRWLDATSNDHGGRRRP